jgi:hypothetical protein
MRSQLQEVTAVPSSEEVKAHARRAAREGAPWMEALGRLGHGVHGVLYAIVGLLAVQAVLGIGGAATDPEGVLVWILEASFGELLLGVMGVSLIAYALWRFVQAAWDTEAKGTTPGGLLARAGFAGSGIAHLALGFSALQLSIGIRGIGDHDAVQEAAAKLLAVPFGQALVLVVGLIVVGVAVGQAYCAYRAEFRENLTDNGMPSGLESSLVALGRVGYAARALVFFLIGSFLILAARDGDSGAARGFGGALSSLAELPYGSWLMLLAGLGLLAYGVFELGQARYRRMVLPIP